MTEEHGLIGHTATERNRTSAEAADAPTSTNVEALASIPQVAATSATPDAGGCRDGRHRMAESRRR
jgi:hypothetical protein